MRINKFIAASTGLSRRTADQALADGRVQVNGQLATNGQEVTGQGHVLLDGRPLVPLQKQLVVFHKPAGYITSRNGQGAASIYDILPVELHHLKPVGRLDKDTSGLLLLTNDGDLAQELTHPRYHKIKIYEATLDKPLAPLHRQMISDIGVQLDDGSSQLGLDRLEEGNDKRWRITMHEGRNRQIRRTFASLGYTVTGLHRIQFGPYTVSGIKTGEYLNVPDGHAGSVKSPRSAA